MVWRMELRHLHYFVGVAQALNFTRAAQILRVAQPALSRQIRQLEEEIGVVLLERNQRGVRLTEAGKAFLAEARALLEFPLSPSRIIRALPALFSRPANAPASAQRFCRLPNADTSSSGWWRAIAAWHCCRNRCAPCPTPA